MDSVWLNHHPFTTTQFWAKDTRGRNRQGTGAERSDGGARLECVTVSIEDTFILRGETSGFLLGAKKMQR